jgi:hypothetical protein
MKTSKLTLVLLMFVSALAYSQSKPLADKQLDRISAGSAVADGESTASDSRTFSLVLSGSALSGASSVNIVNAVNSTIADGSNVWSGDHMNDAIGVTQANFITQRFIPCDCTLASLPGAAVSATAHGGPVPEIEADLAVGNAIAFDGSVAKFSFTESLVLDGSAEANAKALNIVNAVGSIVGNGINMASSTNMHNLVLLTQANFISQVGH